MMRASDVGRERLPRQLDPETWPMTSTYLTYQRLTQDLTKTLAQTASKPEVEREREFSPSAAITRSLCFTRAPGLRI